MRSSTSGPSSLSALTMRVPSKSLEYYLAHVHWLDALTPPLEQHLDALTVRLKALMPLGEAGPLTHPFHAEKSAPTGATGSFTVSETLRRDGEHDAKEPVEAQARERVEKERLEVDRQQWEEQGERALGKRKLLLTLAVAAGVLLVAAIIYISSYPSKPTTPELAVRLVTPIAAVTPSPPVSAGVPQSRRVTSTTLLRWLIRRRLRS